MDPELIFPIYTLLDSIFPDNVILTGSMALDFYIYLAIHNQMANGENEDDYFVEIDASDYDFIGIYNLIPISRNIDKYQVFDQLCENVKYSIGDKSFVVECGNIKIDYHLFSEKKIPYIDFRDTYNIKVVTMEYLYAKYKDEYDEIMDFGGGYERAFPIKRKMDILENLMNYFSGNGEVPTILDFFEKKFLERN